jgi:uncharacterized protein YbcI
MSGTNPEVAGRGALSAAISNSLVGLLHHYTGRGPTKARTTVDENVIVCVMGASLTKGEQSLVHGGNAEVVLSSRRAMQDTIRPDAISSVQELSGRQVVAFMSANHIDPDLAVEIFILELVGNGDSGGRKGDGHVADLNGRRDPQLDPDLT